MSTKHCVKSDRIRSSSGTYFRQFRLNADQKNSEYGHFSRSEKLIDTQTNQQLKAAGLLRYVWPFSGHQALKDKFHVNFFFFLNDEYYTLTDVAYRMKPIKNVLKHLPRNTKIYTNLVEILHWIKYKQNRKLFDVLNLKHQTWPSQHQFC